MRVSHAFVTYRLVGDYFEKFVWAGLTIAAELRILAFSA
eukprot:COSAG05_NODE_291_length_12036_cov_15.352266_9_plen_39_part_00